MRKEKPIRPVAKLHGGAYLNHMKNTADSETVIMPPPETVVIPMQQHIGAPCAPTVKKGDTVYVGTLIGDSDRPVSAPIHSSVSGTVAEIKTVIMTNGAASEAVVINSDGKMTHDPEIKPFPVETEKDLAAAARKCGLVGLGGAGFPAHIKLTRKEGATLDTLIINAAECEPYITSDYRECMENTEDVMQGIYLVKKVLGFQRVFIAVEKNKPLAIEKFLQMAGDKYDTDDSVKVVRLSSKYPQGAEKVLIYNVTGRRLPIGKLPADVGCVVMNVTSIATLMRFIRTGMPLVSKRLTIDGSAIKEPKNVIVPIGTSVADVINFAGGFSEDPEKILYGGPMMGICIADINMPVLKQNNAIIAMSKAEADANEPLPCIHCGRCAAACPMSLTPARVDTAMRSADVNALRALNPQYCIECGSCSYSCPSKRPLTQQMKLAKAKIR